MIKSVQKTFDTRKHRAERSLRFLFSSRGFLTIAHLRRILIACLIAMPALQSTSAYAQSGAPQPTSDGADQVVAQAFAGGRIHLALGFGNTFMVTTDAGNVVIDTSSPANVQRHRALLTAVSKGPVRDIILTHAHLDHVGGVTAWRTPETHVIAQANQTEFRNYLARLRGYFANTGSAQYQSSTRRASAPEGGYPGNFTAPPLADILFDKEYTLKLGDLTFNCFSAPGETPDMLNVWIPELKAVFIGDNYYDSFPNLYTLRGTRPRPALNYVASIDRVLSLHPEIVLPSHGQPIVGAANVQRELTRYRDAILYVHDATVRGMDAGKDVYTLMREIKLPPALEIGESYGAVRWSVRGIYDGYVGWFDKDPASMYAISPATTDAELVRLAGGSAKVAARATALIQSDPALALRLTSAALAADPQSRPSLESRAAALKKLLAASQNSNESGWLRSGLASVTANLGK